MSYEPRETYVMRNGKLVPKRLAAPRQAPSGKRVHVISDEMPPTKHMATGRIHTSKARFRADTRASGCVEVGNDPAISRPRPRPQPHGVHESVRQALQMLNSR